MIKTYFTFDKTAFDNFTNKIDPTKVLLCVEGENGSKNRNKVKESSLANTYFNSFDQHWDISDEEKRRTGFEVFTLKELTSKLGAKKVAKA